MTTFIALLRGINVGGNHLLPMKQLVPLLEELGCSQVRTYIQSGNVVFTGANKPWDTLISKAINNSFGFKPDVRVLTRETLAEKVAAVPFPTDVGAALHLFLLSSIPDAPDLHALEQARKPTEQYELTADAFYLYAPDGVGRSKLAANVERYLGVSGTGRNWNTISKLMTLSTTNGN